MPAHRIITRRGKPLKPLHSWRVAFTSAVCDLKASRRAIAQVLAMHMSIDGDSCFPSVPTIARESGYCERTVYYAIAELVRRGWVEKESRPGRVNRYRAVIPTWWLEAAAQQGVEAIASLEEGVGSGPAARAASSSSDAHAPIRRAHRWLEHAGVHFESVDDVRAELHKLLGDEIQAEALVVRWRQLTGRAGPDVLTAAA
jgi:Helix-turn-helix domain